MRLSTSTNIANFDLRKPYEQMMESAIGICAAAGYRYLDANLCGLSRPGKTVCPMTLDNWEESARSWKKLADSIGVEFLQGHAWFSVEGPVQKGCVPGGEFGEEMMRRSVLAAEILGIHNLVVHPVTVLDGDRMDKEETYRFNLEYYTRWGKVFGEHGLTMAIENMSCPKGAVYPSIWADMDTLCRLADEIGLKNVGVCLDTGHAFMSGLKPEDCVRAIGKRLKATHIADNHGEKDDHVSPYMGEINWTEVVHALKEIGYEEDFSFETHHLTSCFPKQIQPDLIRFSHTLGEYLVNL